MATVTGFTAARMQEIEDSAITNGQVVGNNLVLTRHDGTQINAGNVRGAQGVQGPIGEVSQAELDAATDALQDQITDAALGLVRLVEVESDQTIAGFTPNDWHDVTGATVTFTPTVGRYYQFLAQATCSSEATNTNFDMRIIRVASTEAVCAGFAPINSANRNIPITANRTLLVPAGWAGSQTFKMQVRDDVSNTTYVRGASAYITSFSITDVGKP